MRWENWWRLKLWSSTSKNDKIAYSQRNQFLNIECKLLQTKTLPEVWKLLLRLPPAPPFFSPRNPNNRAKMQIDNEISSRRMTKISKFLESWAPTRHSPVSWSPWIAWAITTIIRRPRGIAQASTWNVTSNYSWKFRINFFKFAWVGLCLSGILFMNLPSTYYETVPIRMEDKFSTQHCIFAFWKNYEHPCSDRHTVKSGYSGSGTFSEQLDEHFLSVVKTDATIGQIWLHQCTFFAWTKSWRPLTEDKSHPQHKMSHQIRAAVPK